MRDAPLNTGIYGLEADTAAGAAWRAPVAFTPRSYSIRREFMRDSPVHPPRVRPIPGSGGSGLRCAGSGRGSGLQPSQEPAGAPIVVVAGVGGDGAHDLDGSLMPSEKERLHARVVH